MRSLSMTACLAAVLTACGAPVVVDGRGTGVAFAQAHVAETTLDFARAAMLYEDAARVGPGPQGQEAWGRALRLRLELRDAAAAGQDLNALRQTYGAEQPPEITALAVAVANLQAERSMWPECIATLATAGPAVDRASLDLRAQAYALLGRAQARNHPPNAGASAAAYAVVRGLRADSEFVDRALRASWPNEDAAQHRARSMRLFAAVAEAQFAAAEAKRVATVDAIPLPTHRGASSKDQFFRFVNTEVKAWQTAKIEAIKLAELEYSKTSSPMPSPRWVVASAARVAHMWAAFYMDYRNLIVPKDWKMDPEELGAYRSAVLELGSDVRLTRAKPAMRKCVLLSQQLDYRDEVSEGCQAWLTRYYPDEFPPLGELAPLPYAPSEGLLPQSPALRK